jgi:hypothetical protein
MIADLACNLPMSRRQYEPVLRQEWFVSGQSASLADCDIPETVRQVVFEPRDQGNGLLIRRTTAEEAIWIALGTPSPGRWCSCSPKLLECIGSQNRSCIDPPGSCRHDRAVFARVDVMRIGFAGLLDAKCRSFLIRFCYRTHVPLGSQHSRGADLRPAYEMLAATPLGPVHLDLEPRHFPQCQRIEPRRRDAGG